MIGNVEIIGRLLAAAFLGSLIGFERERLVWAAGMRTHMLVCVGSCLIMIVSAFGFSDVLGRPNVTLDPSRIAAQVVSGIGFLGAGTILMRGEVVKGLTTAASLWAVAAIGLAAGSGLYAAAVATTVIVLVILAGVKPLAERYRERHHRQDLHLVAQRGALSVDGIQTIAGRYASRVFRFVAHQRVDDGLDEITVSFVQVPRKGLDGIAQSLRDHDGVVSVDIRDAT